MPEKTAVDDVQVSLVRDELRAATDVGEHRSRQQLQEAVGLGSGDLDAVLNVMQESGEATEQAPDEWVLSRADEPPPPEPRGRGEEESDEEPVEEADTHRGTPIPGRPRAPEEPGENVRVELPFAVAKSIDPEGLGKIVEAGIMDAMDKHVSFVLVVES